MQQAPQFCNVNHAMVAWVPWLLPINQMGKTEITIHMSATMLANNMQVINKKFDIYDVTRNKPQIHSISLI